ncbi:EAL domain-containing protein [Vibrio sp. DNB22_10_4]
MYNRDELIQSESIDKQRHQDSVFGVRYVSVFVIYIVSAFLFSSLSPQSQIVSLWPPAGIALAGCILWQVRFVPAIVAGSIIFNVGVQAVNGTDIGAMAILTSFGIGLGSAVQAWVNYRCLAYFSVNIISSASIRKVTLFVVFALICCLISSVLGSFFVDLSPTEGLRDYDWSNMLIWWLGDFLGVIVITPLVLAVLKPTGRLTNKLTHYRALIFSLVLVLAVLVVSQKYGNKSLELKSLNEIHIRSQLIEKNLNHQVENYLNSLSLLAVKLSGNSDVTQDEFNRLTLPLIEQTPGVRGFSWNPVIEQHELEEFEKSTDKQSDSSFKVRGTPLKLGDPLVVVKWIEPFAPNERAFGFNVFSNGKRREAMIRAQNISRPVATETIQLVQLDAKEPGFLIFTPINQGPSLGTSTLTRSFNLSGFVVGVFVVGDIVTESLKNSDVSYMSVKILDSSANDEVIYQYAPIGVSSFDESIEFSFVQQIAEREWTVVLSVSQDVISALKAESSVKFLIYESAFGALSVLLIITLFNSHTNLLTQVKTRTQELEASRDTLKHFAFNDALTGLPNRRMFIKQTNHALNVATRNGSMVAILFLDLDRFKHVNDSLGHDFGDKLLVEVATRLTNNLRSSDVLARFGGDEFTIMIENLTNAEQAVTLSRKLIEGLRKPMLIEDESIAISTSIGIATFPKDGNNVDDLMRAADAAMYKAKESSSGYVCYTNTLRKQAREKLFIESELPQALMGNQLELYFQPIIDLRSGEHVGCEGLLRWNHPKYGVIPPEAFIPIAELSKEILPIGAWVLREVCKQIKSWKNTGIVHQKVSVNVSVVQLMSGRLLSDVKAALELYEVNPNILELEITESVLVQNMAQATTYITELKKLGVKIAIDDYGTGYSSLVYLKQLPVDSLKIDKIFIAQLRQGDRTIVSSTLQMASELGFEVIAEGIQTSEQMNILVKHGCRWGQGFLFSKPLSIAHYTEFCRKQ